MSAVGTPVTRRPLHSPGRAVLPHPVPRSHSLSRKTGPSCEHPPGRPHHNAGFPEQATIHRSPEGLSRETLPLTAPSIEPFECTFHSPQIEAIDRVSVAYDPEVVVVTPQASRERRMLLLDREVSVAPTPVVHGAYRPCQARRPCLARHLPTPSSGSAPIQREAEEVEGVRTLPALLTLRRWPKVDQTSLVRMKVQPVLLHPFAQRLLCNTQQAGGNGLIAAGPPHRFGNQQVGGLFDGRQLFRKADQGRSRFRRV